MLKLAKKQSVFFQTVSLIALTPIRGLPYPTNLKKECETKVRDMG